MSKGFSVLIAGFTFLLMAGVASGQELEGTLKKIKTTGVLAIGYRASAPPFSFPGPDKRPVGYSIDLCKLVAGAVQKQLGLDSLKLDWKTVTAENRMELVEKGEVDIECGTTTITLSRHERVEFSLMTFVDGGSLLTKSGTNIRTLADLADKRIAVIPNTTTEKALAEFLKKEFITPKIVNVKDHLEGLTAVDKGLADCFASDRGILIGLVVTSKDPDSFKLANVLFSYEPYGLMMRRNDPAFRLAVNKALAEVYRSGDIVPIYDRWFGSLGKPSEALQMMYLLNALPE